VGKRLKKYLLWIEISEDDGILILSDNAKKKIEFLIGNRKKCDNEPA